MRKLEPLNKDEITNETFQIIINGPDGAAGRTLLALATLTDYRGVTFVTQESIAEACGMSERTFREHLQALEADGWLRRVQRVKEGRNVGVQIFIPKRAIARAEGEQARRELIEQLVQQEAEQLGARLVVRPNRWLYVPAAAAKRAAIAAADIRHRSQKDQRKQQTPPAEIRRGSTGGNPPVVYHRRKSAGRIEETSTSISTKRAPARGAPPTHDERVRFFEAFNADAPVGQPFVEWLDENVRKEIQ